jgi:hypothetical protein
MVRDMSVTPTRLNSCEEKIAISYFTLKLPLADNCTSVIPVPRRLKKEDHEFEDSWVMYQDVVTTHLPLDNGILCWSSVQVNCLFI